jgi:hypothetical protein
MKASAQTLQTAAAVLCLVGENAVSLQDSLVNLGENQAIKEIERTLQTGDKASRARSIALILERLGMELDAWRIA